jgi:CMP/dCMP kinase
MSRPITIAIDGPAGAGKSTVSKRVAEALGFTLVDTGAIYRVVALQAHRSGVAWDDDAKLGPIADVLPIRFEMKSGKNHVFLGKEDVSEAIRTPEMSMGASKVSARPVVRAKLLELQRRLAGQGGAVLEGRDIGTVVCPDAPVKIYLDASPEERARRRWKELTAKGNAPSFEEVLADQVKRDAQDSQREVAPLKPARDARVLDSTKLSIDQVVEQIVQAARSL